MAALRRPNGGGRRKKEALLTEALLHVSARDAKAGGEMVLPKGSIIDLRAVGLLAGKGIDRLIVYDEPRISLLAIGNELLAPGASSRPGKTYDSSLSMMQAALDSMRLRPVFARRLMNQPKVLRRIIPFALNQSDLIILIIKEAWREQIFLRELLEGMASKAVIVSEGQGLSVEAFDEDRKLVICVPHDSERVFDSFYKCVRPAIQFFMGYARPAAI